MSFNIWFDTASLIFLLLIIWRFYSLRLFPSHSNRWFGIITWVAAADIVFDILSVLCLDHIDTVPLMIVKLVNLCYFVVQLFIPSVITLYLSSLIYHTGGITKTTYKLLLIPSILAEIVLLVSIPKGLVYTITAESGYQRGPMASLPYICCAVYFAISVCIIILFREYFSKEIKTAFAFMIVILSLCMMIQLAFPGFLMIGTGITISLLIFFMTFQNPSVMVDSVTGLLNQSAFELMIQSMQQSGGQSMLIITELDGISVVNSMHGVNNGNKLLRLIADYISECDRSYAFRISDNRFALTFRDKNAYDQAVKHLSQRTTYRWPVSDPDETALINMRICLFPHSDSISEVEALRDVIEYAYLENEAPIIEVDQTAEDLFNRRSQISSTLIYALNNNRKFTMNYQPIYCLSEKRFSAAEALLRFSDPVLGSVFPNELFEVAGRLGIYGAIDRAVVSSVFDDISKGFFDNCGFSKIHINLSAASFASSSMAEFIIDTQKKYGIDPKQIGFEITETITDISIDEFNSFVSTLKPLGYSFSLDDFGTGSSNIARLVLLPFDCVKLDRRLLEFGSDTYHTIASMIFSLNRRIIAEGIESYDQVGLVSDTGIDEIQGYFYSRPVPPEDLDSVMENMKQIITEPVMK